MRALEAAEPFSDSFHAADLDFHLAVCAASGNGLVERLSRILMPLCDSIGADAHPSGSAAGEIRLRRELFGAVERGDAAAAREIAAEIVSETRPERLDRSSDR